jgi:hypothetical protein
VGNLSLASEEGNAARAAVRDLPAEELRRCWSEVGSILCSNWGEKNPDKVRAMLAQMQQPEDDDDVD